MNVVVVGVGSNLGAREASIRGARALLHAREGITVREVSPIYETAPLGPPQPPYLNAAFRLETDLSPLELLHIMLRTERRLGRRRLPNQRWGPRSIDLDLLWDQRGAHSSAGLRVPHPELENRGFALAPLLDVAPELEPVFGRSLERLGGRPPAWNREARARVRSIDGGFRVDVKAGSLLDACALCVGQTHTLGRPWSTRHVTIKPGAEHFAIALQSLFRTGFSAQQATISHCSQSQWLVEFHGVNLGIALDTHVRLCTTLDTTGEVHAQLSLHLSSA